VGAKRARRTHLAHDPRLDDGAAGAVVEEPRRGKARGAATPKRAAAPWTGPRESAGLLRGLERLRQERFCTSRARRADAAWTDAKIVVSGHLGLIGCRKLSDDNAFPNIARCARYGAMFGAWLKLLPSSPRPTARTLRALSCPPRSLLSSAQLPSCRLPRARSGLRQDPLPVIAVGPHIMDARTGQRRAVSVQKTNRGTHRRIATFQHCDGRPKVNHRASARSTNSGASRQGTARLVRTAASLPGSSASNGVTAAM